MTHSFQLQLSTDAKLTLSIVIVRSLRVALNDYLREISLGYDASVLNYSFDKLVDLQESFYAIIRLQSNIFFNKSLFDEYYSIKQYLRK